MCGWKTGESVGLSMQGRTEGMRDVVLLVIGDSRTQTYCSKAKSLSQRLPCATCWRGAWLSTVCKEPAICQKSRIADGQTWGELEVRSPWPFLATRLCHESHVCCRPRYSWRWYC